MIPMSKKIPVSWVHLLQEGEFRPSCDIKQIIPQGEKVFARFEDGTFEIYKRFLSDTEVEFRLNQKLVIVR